MNYIIPIFQGLGDVIVKYKHQVGKQLLCLFFGRVGIIDMKITRGSNFALVRIWKDRSAIIQKAGEIVTMGRKKKPVKGLKIAKRENHVKSNTFNKIPENLVPRVGRLVIQKHDASHKHFDISIIEGKEEIFRGAVTKKEMESLFPKTSARSTSFVRQPQHEVSYSTKTPDVFEIPKGEYGAGTVERVFDQPIDIHKTESGKVSFSIYTGGLEGKYTLVDGKKPNKAWFCVRSKDPIADVLGKPKFRMIGKNNNKEITPEMLSEIDKYLTSKDGQKHEAVYEEKLDGGNNYFKFKKDGNLIWSHRASKKTGDAIFHQDNYEHLRDEIHPELEDTVVRAEIVYSDGKVSRLQGKFFKAKGKQHPSIVAGLSNKKNPFESRDSRKDGNVSLVIWDIDKYKGKSVKHLNYDEKLVFMDFIAEKSKNIFVSRRWKNIEEAWNTVVKKEGGEGVVVKRLDLPSPQPDGGIVNTWLKAKSHEFIDVSVIGWEPLKFSDTKKPDDTRLGKFFVKDDKGRKFEVGSGIPEFERKWFRKNIDKILEGDPVIKVRFDAETEKAVLKGVYKGVHYEKSDGKITELSLEKSASELGVSPYQLKSAKGWKKK